ncbi:helix-turn-helix transcriptional regulator [Amycolatopsis suaedae]|uniref:helix-turn-helix transcriptional regulator n=1 Tax=Amycolatopsis suaedae TaxID=2510978 RepID=UPI0013EEF54E|nr:LuxR family transcriptional regulator [Amycolatopsis suaedae]
MRRPRSAGGTAPLFGREAELDLLRVQATRAVGDRRAQVVLVTGEFGAGKSALLDAAATRARADGFAVVTGKGMPLETRLPGGLVNQLSDGLRRLIGEPGPAHPATEPEGDQESDALAAFHALVRDAAGRGPLLLAIDDAHLADPWSLRCLAYTRVRVADLPILALLTINRGQPPHGEVTLPDVTGCGPRTVDLTGLPECGVADLVATTTGHRDPAFTAACREMTGGNPYLLRSLVGVVRRRFGSPAELGIDELRELGDASLGEVLRVRLRPHPGAARVARAVAVLGQDATLDAIAELAGLDQRATLRAVETLVRLRILADSYPPAYTYPYLRNTMLADMCVAERAANHAHAAKLLHDAGVACRRVAGHLLAAGPIRLPWGVEVLRKAAREAVPDGRAEFARRCLARALDEPMPPDQALAVRLELGHVEYGIDRTAGKARLREALGKAEDPTGAAAVTEAMVLRSCGIAGIRLALSVAIQVVARLGAVDHDLAQGLRYLTYLAAAGGDPSSSGCAARVYDELCAEEPGDPRLRRARAVLTAVGHLRSGDSAGEALRRVAEALGGEPIPAISLSYPFALFVPLLADQPDQADRFCQQVGSDTAPRDHHLRKGTASSIAEGAIAQTRGDLPKARAFLEAPLRTFEDMGAVAECPMATLCLAWLVEVLVDLGRPEDAAELLERNALTGVLPEVFPHALLLHARGRLRLADGDPKAGLADLLECGRRLRARGVVNPAILDWRGHAVRAYLALDMREPAAKLAKEGLRAARRWGTPRTVGLALLAVGLSTEDTLEAERALAEAVEALAASRARQHYAEASAELGTLLRRRGRPEDAVPHLRRAVELAARCAAKPLARMAADELRAAEGTLRPGRDTVHGLTKQETRIAGMAARGLTNRQIADALHLTRRTVELHLSGAYRKLGISGRADLSTALLD